MSFDWKLLVGSVAPTIATALGGPLAGTAVKALSRTLLGTDTGTEKEISAVLQSADPETILKLKQADNEFDLKMRELDIDIEKVNAADRDSARKRETESKDNMNEILALIVVVAFVGTTAATLIGWTKVETVLAGTLIGYLSAKCEQVLTYYFGSNKSSARKTELIAKAESIRD